MRQVCVTVYPAAHQCGDVVVEDAQAGSDYAACSCGVIPDVGQAGSVYERGDAWLHGMALHLRAGIP